MKEKKIKFIRQKDHLDVKNFESKPINKNKKHGNLLPSNIRAIICGPSSCGKTNIMLSLLTHQNGLKYENIYLYAKTMHQPKYIFLKECVKRIKGLGFYQYSDNENIMKPENAKQNSIFIFDDVITDKQDTMRDYFCRGRHNNIDSFYLSQTYTRIPKHLIRDNTNFIILFKQDELNLRHIYDDHVNVDMSFDFLKKFCAECWKIKYSFVVIDKDNKIGRYRKGFSDFLKCCV